MSAGGGSGDADREDKELVVLQVLRSLELPGAFTLAVAALALLAGCAPDGEEPGVVTLRVVTWKPNDPTAWEEALRRFHEAYPDIRVEREVGPSSSTALHDLLAMKLRNRDPSVDVFLMDVVWPAELGRAGWALALDEFYPPEERARFFAACIDAVTVGDSVYGVPFNTDAGVLYYRKDLLAEQGFDPPATWRELVAQCEEILAQSGQPGLSGYSAQMKQYEGLVCNMLELVASNRGSLLRPDEPHVLNVLGFVRDRIVGHVAPEGILTYDEQESLDLFKSGGAVFHRNWPYAWAVLQDPDLSRVSGRVGIARLPAFEDGERAAALGGWSFGIHARTRHPEAAWSFVRFMTGRKIQKLFALRAGKAPARRALLDDPEVLRANPHFRELRPAFEAARPRPKTPVYPRISHVLQGFLHRVLSDVDADVRALAREARQEIDQALARVR